LKPGGLLGRHSRCLHRDLAALYRAGIANLDLVGHAYGIEEAPHVEVIAPDPRTGNDGQRLDTNKAGAFDPYKRQSMAAL
jgi:hypothetical protein